MSTPVKKNKHMKTFFRRALIVLISIILGVNIYLLNANSIGGSSMPMPFGVGTAVVLSGSMEPVLSKNDLVVVKQEDSYNVGDIVVYQKDGELIIHRIISVLDDQTVQTQGDANNTPDDPIKTIYIKGKLLFSLKGVGVIVRALKAPVSIIIMLVLAVLLMEGSYRKQRNSDDENIQKIKDEINKLKAQKNEKNEKD